jgi:hypothetical protein
MSNLPNWIVSELRHSKHQSESFPPRLRHLFRSEFKTPEVLRNSPKALNLHKISKTYLKKKRIPHLEPIEFKNKCSKLWMKFDSRLNSIVRKFSPSIKQKVAEKNPFYTPQLKFYKNANKERLYNLRRASNPIQNSFSTDEEYAEYGVQCDLKSESSENDVKVHVANYVHYINL